MTQRTPFPHESDEQYELFRHWQEIAKANGKRLVPLEPGTYQVEVDDDLGGHEFRRIDGPFHRGGARS